MGVPYRDLLSQIRLAFPQPVSDRIHDSYFVFSLMRTLDQIDALKSEIPWLGGGRPLDYAGARQARMASEVSTVEQVAEELVSQFRGLPIWGHPRAQMNVVSCSSIASIIGVLLPAIYNPNLVSDDTAHGILEAEVRVTAMAADLIGYDPDVASGLFTFGGTGTNLYGVKIGLEKALPGTMEAGVRGDAVILASEQCHYSRLNVAGWLGLGERNVIEVASHSSNDVDLDLLTEAAERALRDGRRIAAIIATMGTTDAFGVDDLEAIVAMRDRLVTRFQLDYRPHVHADAVIGWAWSVFTGYSFEENPLGFRPRTVRALAGVRHRIKHLGQADSVGLDFHKTGFAPYVSSLFLVRDQADLHRLVRGRGDMPYLFQSGEHHPGLFSLETSRGGGGVLSALGSLRLLGKTGLRALLGHLVEMAELLREHLEGHRMTTVLNGENFGTVTLFRVYPDGVDTWTIKERERTDPAARDLLLAHNDYNRRIYRYLRDEAMAGRGVLISMTECYRLTDYEEPIVALKVYVLSPFVDEADVELLVTKVLEARQHVSAEAPAD
jgi:glutamate/tyrosine decarboxylase-like PLP-dependent enzyme